MKKLTTTLLIIFFISIIFTLNCKVEASMLEEKVFTITNEEQHDDDDIEDHIMVYDARTGETNKANIKIQSLGTNSIESIEEYSPKQGYTSKIFNLISEVKSGRPNSYVRVSTPKVQPYCRTLKVRYYDEKGERIGGSAALIGPKVALTAAHCIWDGKNNNYIYRNWTCWPGYDMNTCIGAGTGWSRVFYDDRWRTTHDARYDWAIVVLQADYTEVAGWYGVNRYEDYTSLVTQQVTSYGFPAVKPGATSPYYDAMYTTGDRILSATDSNFTYSGVTTGGFSGGPVIEDYTGRILGIHIGKEDSSGKPLAVRITTQIINSAREALKY